MLSDTDPKAEEVQLELIRRLTPGQRLARVRALTRETGERARRAIMKANPGLTEEEYKLLFCEFHYGKDLADRVRVYLEKRKKTSPASA